MFSRGCGEESKWMLEQILKNEIITCFYKQKDKYGRIIGICYVGELDYIPILMLSPQFEINGAMVNMGLAIAYKRYSNRYIKLEDDAKKITGVFGKVNLKNLKNGERKINEL